MRCDARIEFPFWRIPVLDRVIGRPKLLFYPRAARQPRGVWVKYTRILVDFAEQVLTVNVLKPTAPQGLEVQPETSKLILLSVRDKANEICLGESAKTAEAFSNTIARARSWDNKLSFAKACQIAVVESPVAYWYAKNGSDGRIAESSSNASSIRGAFAMRSGRRSASIRSISRRCIRCFRVSPDARPPDGMMYAAE